MNTRPLVYPGPLSHAILLLLYTAQLATPGSDIRRILDAEEASA